jgi:hypothetical protein
MKSLKSSLPVVALPVALLSANSALAMNMCVVAGNRPIMGADMTAAFDVQAGEGCMYDISPQGTLFSSEISQLAQHGIVRMVDMATWTYEPAAGYSGPDAFAIIARGKSIDESPGTSVLSFSVNVR